MELKNPITTSIVSLVERIESDYDINHGLAGEPLVVNASWPADGIFKEPSITILAPSTKFISAFPHDIAYDANIDGAKNGALRFSRYNIGSLNIVLYAYCYGKNLRQRSILEAGVMNILNTSEDIHTYPDTLVLKPTNYFSEPIRYRLDGIIYSDSEMRNLQSQFCSVLSINVDMNWVVSKEQYEILTMDLHITSAISKYINSVSEEVIIVL